MTIVNSSARIRRIIERIPMTPENTEVRMLLEQEAANIEDFLVQYNDSLRQPPWLELVYDWITLLCQCFIYTGFLIRSVYNPQTSIRDAPAWSLEALRKLEASHYEQKFHRLRAGQVVTFRTWVKGRYRDTGEDAN